MSVSPEHAPSTVAFYLLPAIPLRNISGEPALDGAGSSLWHFAPRCASSVCVEGSRVSTPERATRAWHIKGVEDLSENCAA